MSNRTPHLSLCMIVKNEEETLDQTIQSVKTIADEIIIVDTGSSDKTLEIAKKYASLVIQIPWKDNFAEARNISLEEASGKWILVLDADEILLQDDIDKIKRIIDQEQHLEGLFLQIINYREQLFSNDEESFPSLRLFKNNPSYRFSGAIHEQIASSIPFDKLAVTDIRIIHHGLNNTAKNLERGNRNLHILKKEIAKEPENHFHKFNLGVEYMVNKEYKKAVNQFEQIKDPDLNKPMWLSRYYKTFAYCYIKEKEWGKAKNLIEKGVKQFPDFPDLYYLQAMGLIAQEKYREALFPLYTCLSIGETANPVYISEKGMGSYKAYFILGSIYEALGEIKKAVISYQNALQFNFNHIQAGSRLLKILLQDEPVDKVIHFLNAIYDDSNPKHLLIIAKIFFEAKEFTVCMKYAKKVLDKVADKDPVYHLLGLCSFVKDKKTAMNRYFSNIKDKDTYKVTHLDLLLLSVKNQVDNLQEIENKFHGAKFFIEERERLEHIIRLYEMDD